MMPPSTCAFLTIADMGGFVSDDDLAVAELQARGWRVDLVPWDASVRWSDYDAVVIRTTWDYHDQPERFLQTLGDIERAGVALFNQLPLVQWNVDKRYLADLQNRGVPIVPTTFHDCLDGQEGLVAHFLHFDTEDLILKPLISASAFNTFRVPRAELESFLPGLTAVFGSRAYMAQPFMPRIRSEGEYSVICLDGRISHALLKTPAHGDFRVQEEYGGLITAVDPPPGLIDAASRALDVLPQIPLYARVDLVRDNQDRFLLMELELIEPSLYLRMDSDAPVRFADALQAALLIGS